MTGIINWFGGEEYPGGPVPESPPDLVQPRPGSGIEVLSPEKMAARLAKLDKLINSLQRLSSDVLSSSLVYWKQMLTALEGLQKEVSDITFWSKVPPETRRRASEGVNGCERLRKLYFSQRSILGRIRSAPNRPEAKEWVKRSADLLTYPWALMGSQLKGTIATLEASLRQSGTVPEAALAPENAQPPKSTATSTSPTPTVKPVISLVGAPAPGEAESTAAQALEEELEHLAVSGKLAKLRDLKGQIGYTLNYLNAPRSRTQMQYYLGSLGLVLDSLIPQSATLHENDRKVLYEVRDLLKKCTDETEVLIKDPYNPPDTDTENDVDKILNLIVAVLSVVKEIVGESRVPVPPAGEAPTTEVAEPLAAAAPVPAAPEAEIGPPAPLTPQVEEEVVAPRAPESMQALFPYFPTLRLPLPGELNSVEREQVNYILRPEIVSAAMTYIINEKGIYDSELTHDLVDEVVDEVDKDLGLAQVNPAYIVRKVLVGILVQIGKKELEDSPDMVGNLQDYRGQLASRALAAVIETLYFAEASRFRAENQARA